MKNIILSFLFVVLAAFSAPSAYAATLTVYPDAGSGSTTVDGDPKHEVGAGTTWTALATGVGTGLFNPVTTTVIELVRIDSDTDTDEWNLNARSVFTFDTSSIPDDNNINSATISFYINTLFDGLSITPNLNVYSASPASDNDLVAGDYDGVGSTELSTTKTYASLTNNAYNDFTLNASGITNIDATGVSGFSTRNAEYDVADVAPTWSSNTVSRIRAASADNGGTTNDPKLVIQHAPDFIPAAIIIE
jgi:hypothetical protein